MSGNVLLSGYTYYDMYMWLYDGSTSQKAGNGECTKYNTNYEATAV